MKDYVGWFLVHVNEYISSDHLKFPFQNKYNFCYKLIFNNSLVNITFLYYNNLSLTCFLSSFFSRFFFSFLASHYLSFAYSVSTYFILLLWFSIKKIIIILKRSRWKFQQGMLGCMTSLTPSKMTISETC